MATASTTAVMGFPRRATTFPGRAPDPAPRREAPRRPVPPATPTPAARPAPRGGRLPAIVYWRRRAAVLAALAAVALLFALFAGTGGAGAQAEHRAAGYVTVEPGQTLWEIAVTRAPAGTDPRSYLADLRRINGLESASVPAWTVVMLPAR